MCQYSAVDGHVTDWHLVHIGGFASRGVGAICMEASAVVPKDGFPRRCGNWDDSHIPGFQRIVNFAHGQGTLIGIQLAHAGRKASTYSLWVHSDIARTRSAPTHTVQKDEGGWPDGVYGPTELPFSNTYPKPNANNAYVKAIERCKVIGFDFVEIHAAHGFLLHEFVSPLSNTRSDQYGGQSLENRVRWPLRVISRCRAAWDKPLFVRISATDWAEGPERGPGGEWKQWGIEQSKVYGGELQKLDIDLLHCSSGGNWERQQIELKPGYQVPFADALKKAYPTLPIGAVGLITDPVVAESYLREGKTDVIFLARALMRNPHWAMYAAETLGVAVKAANQYERAFLGLATPAKPAIKT
ncbi:FMN-linked oxidoreductase [Amylocystis lapponica]|nr:FMN-linked oxidoreductase [Amylocystis lapponica]